NSPELMRIVHTIPVTVSPDLRSSYVYPVGTATEMNVAPDGSSRSTLVVDTLPSVGTRTTYFSYAPSCDSRGQTVTCANALDDTATAMTMRMLQLIVRFINVTSL